MNQWNSDPFSLPKLDRGSSAKAALAMLIATGLFSTVSAQVFESGTVTLPGLISDAGARPDTEMVAEQYLLAGTASRGCGESQLAVNPINPNEIAVSAMCQQHQNEGGFQQNEREFERTTRATITEFAITRDRGLTWALMEDPMRAYFHRYRRLDPFAAFAPDGRMILGCESHFAENPTPRMR